MASIYNFFPTPFSMHCAYFWWNLFFLYLIPISDHDMIESVPLFAIWRTPFFIFSPFNSFEISFLHFSFVLQKKWLLLPCLLSFISSYVKSISCMIYCFYFWNIQPLKWWKSLVIFCFSRNYVTFILTLFPFQVYTFNRTLYFLGKLSHTQYFSCYFNVKEWQLFFL